MHYYSPHTGEIIYTDNPASWMLSTDVALPDCPEGSSLVFNGTAWVETAPTPVVVTKTQFSVLDFRGRFTMAEQIAIRQAQLSDMEVGLVYDAFISAQYIDITDPRVGQGIDLYISKGLLESPRKTELLTPQATE